MAPAAIAVAVAIAIAIAISRFLSLDRRVCERPTETIGPFDGRWKLPSLASRKKGDEKLAQSVLLEFNVDCSERNDLHGGLRESWNSLPATAYQQPKAQTCRTFSNPVFLESSRAESTGRNCFRDPRHQTCIDAKLALDRLRKASWCLKIGLAVVYSKIWTVH